MLESPAVGRQAHSKVNEVESIIGVKRGQPISGSDAEDKGPSSKRVKMNTGVKAETTEINSTNSLFRKFVNNALDERAAVSFLILSKPLPRSSQLTLIRFTGEQCQL